MKTKFHEYQKNSYKTVSRKILLVIGCIATAMCFAQQEGGSGSTSMGGTFPDKKPGVQNLLEIGDPILAPGPKKKDYARSTPGTWQICTRACWTWGHVAAIAYAWYQPADIPCGHVAWPDEKVYFVEGYKLNGRLVITDSGWTDGDHMEC